MKQTNEMKFSSYGVWDLIRKVYQNKEDLLPKMGFKKFEEFLDWLEDYGDQDTQDEFEDIVNKYEMEKASPMTESKLKQVIKEEIKRVLNENSTHNKNSMIRGMINMLKHPEIHKASFEDLMNMNITIQNLLPPPRTVDPDSPANRAAIKAMIDTDKNRSLD